MAAIKNLTIDQGSVFYANLQYLNNSKLPISLTGYTITSQLRKSYYAANAATITTTVTDAGNGNVRLYLSSAQTGLLKSGRYVYDVEASTANDTIRIFEGEISVTPGVTGNSSGSLFVSTEAFTNTAIVYANTIALLKAIAANSMSWAEFQANIAAL